MGGGENPTYSLIENVFIFVTYSYPSSYHNLDIMGLDIVALDILSIRHYGNRHCGMFPKLSRRSSALLLANKAVQVV